MYTDRLILKKGCSKDCIKVYEYDLLKCRGIAGEEVLEKVNENSFKKNGVDIDSYVSILNKNDWYGRHKVL